MCIDFENLSSSPCQKANTKGVLVKGCTAESVKGGH